ncbi:MAG TPA: HEPN domain-containing protein [Ignavibacteria bacterium]|nr:HEPN domain-containing protein [Ignavibacteria bacterium]HMQ98606.1 HEPN domain-containing protein [Ignavibacteria bacterium]
MSANHNKQVEYWIAGADSDIETAKLLLENDKILHGLFFCHLSVEKILKSIIVNTSGEFAPKSHNIFFLAEKCGVKLPEEFETLAGILMKYQLEGRYPDYEPDLPDKEKAWSYYNQTLEFKIWLKEKL